jgi:hypothetical protein
MRRLHRACMVLTGSAAYLFLGYRCPNEWAGPRLLLFPPIGSMIARTIILLLFTKASVGVVLLAAGMTCFLKNRGAIRN